MNNDKLLCVLARYDAQTEKRLADFQQQLYDCGFSGTQTKDIFMHATLGTYTPADETMLIQQMQRAAEECASFDVSFQHIGIFGGSKVLFIAPEVSHNLLTLKEYFGPSDGWSAHTTMLIDEPETIFRAVPILSERFASFSGRIESLHLYEFWPTRPIFSIDLK